MKHRQQQRSLQSELEAAIQNKAEWLQLIAKGLRLSLDNELHVQSDKLRFLAFSYLSDITKNDGTINPLNCA